MDQFAERSKGLNWSDFNGKDAYTPVNCYGNSRSIFQKYCFVNDRFKCVGKAAGRFI
jgi:hypothetical protein